MVASPQSPLPFRLTIYLSTGFGLHLRRVIATGGQFALPARGFQFAIAFGMDGFVVAEELVVGRDITDGAVQADVVVVLDEIGDDPSRVIQR